MSDSTSYLIAYWSSLPLSVALGILLYIRFAHWFDGPPDDGTGVMDAYANQLRREGMLKS